MVVRIRPNPSSANYADSVNRAELPSTKNQDGTVNIPVALVVPLDPNVNPAVNRMPVVLLDPVSNTPILSPTTFKTGSANAIGSTALWTPATGKKFRILGFSFTLPSTATTAAGSTITLMDNATAVFTLLLVGTTSDALSGVVNLPSGGYLSAVVNNVLNINLTAALTAGAIAVNAWGLEE